MMLGPAERLVKHSSTAGLGEERMLSCPRVRGSLATQHGIGTIDAEFRGARLAT
jgi:hypothetical protein